MLKALALFTFEALSLFGVLFMLDVLSPFGAFLSCAVPSMFVTLTLFRVLFIFRIRPRRICLPFILGYGPCLVYVEAESLSKDENVPHRGQQALAHQKSFRRPTIGHTPDHQPMMME